MYVYIYMYIDVLYTSYAHFSCSFCFSMANLEPHSFFARHFPRRSLSGHLLAANDCECHFSPAMINNRDIWHMESGGAKLTA